MQFFIIYYHANASVCAMSCAGKAACNLIDVPAAKTIDFVFLLF